MSADRRNTSGHQCCLMPDGKHETWCPYSGEYHWLRTAEFVESLRAQLAERNKVIELVYGLLWTTVDMPDGITQPPATYPPHATLSKARERLLTLLDREGQKRGIIAARLVLGGDTHE